MKFLFLTIIFTVGFLFPVISQDDIVWMHPNQGQWDSRIEYKVELSLGEMYIEKDGFLYYLSDAKEKLHHHHEEKEDTNIEEYNFHVIRSQFVGSTWNGEREENLPSTFYRNYFYGNDPAYWKSGLESYRRILLKNYYEGIDLLMESGSASLKYSLEVQPGVDANQIQIKYTGQDKLEIDENGNLNILNRFGKIIEEKPVAWTIRDGIKREVDVDFLITENGVTFNFPNGYDESAKLVIDPNLTFSTFTGSTVDNWGMSATPDDNANLFGGGTIFTLTVGGGNSNTGYPVTTGAYSSSHSGGTVDIGITKFNDLGTTLLYSTYIGGNGSETPNSMICSPSGELFIFGVTSSSNFPMAGSSYDPTYNGGPDVSANANGLGFTQGSDLYVLRMNATGTGILASTYIGGSGTDGINISGLKYNYGDQFRGEIILDANNNIYVASTTQSSNFPTAGGGLGFLNGTQDAVVFKMPPSLSSLSWSTYMGGTGFETGNSIGINSIGDIFITGGTSSSNLPFNMGVDLTFDGGISDGYIIKLNGLNGGVVSGSYIGANEYDQSYFVQLDIDDYVYVYGQTETNLGITSGHYGVNNSGQFIWKYNSMLSNVEWKTMFGAGSGHVEISPTAFLVSDCYDIYIAGWGGQLNVQYSQATNSTTNGFQVTSDAYQNTTNGSNFYLALFDQNAYNLKYATFIGGQSSSFNHVDGGTSRFDKYGRIYHSVCGSCSSPTNGFTTTPGAWSTTDNGPNCNMACFKFELNKTEAVVSEPAALICLPDPVIFNNNSSNGNSFYWDFGDGTTSTEVNPSHVYPGAGDYTVSLIVVDTNSCFSADSVEFNVHIGDFNGGVVEPAQPICPGEAFQFEAYGGAFYSWSPSEFLDNPTISNPVAIVEETTEFMVVVSDSCGVDTINVTLPVYPVNINVSNDTSVCIGNVINLFATGGGSYQWFPGTFLDNATSANPICTPDSNITYTIEITTPFGCIYEEQVAISVFYDPPVPILDESASLCLGQSITLTADGAENYYWSPNQFINQIEGAEVIVNPVTDMYYYCDFVNSCGLSSDSIFIDVIVVDINAWNDTIICPGETGILQSSGGVSYNWTPIESIIDNPNSDIITVQPIIPTVYYVTGWDSSGCPGNDSVFVDLFPEPWVKTNPDVYAFLYDEIQLSAEASSSGLFTWSPGEYLSCVNCIAPVSEPNKNYAYQVLFVDENGCIATDSIHIYYDPILYVPNTFTPDGNEFNHVFKVKGGNIDEFEMLIFNRWGELIYTLTSLEDSWDGTYNGMNCQDGTYVWKAKFSDFTGEKYILTGHVNLIR